MMIRSRFYMLIAALLLGGAVQASEVEITNALSLAQGVFGQIKQPVVQTVTSATLNVYGKNLRNLGVIALNSINGPQASYVGGQNWNNIYSAYKSGMTVTINEATQTFTINGTISRPLAAVGGPYVIFAMDEVATWVSPAMSANGTCTIVPGTGAAPTNAQMILAGNLRSMTIFTTTANGGGEMFPIVLDSTSINTINSAASKTATITVDESTSHVNVTIAGITTPSPVFIDEKGSPYLAIAIDSLGNVSSLLIPATNNTFTLTLPGAPTGTQAGTQTANTTVISGQATIVTTSSSNQNSSGAQTGTQTKTQTGVQTGTQTGTQVVSVVPSATNPTLTVYGTTLKDLSIVALSSTLPEPTSYCTNSNWQSIGAAYKTGMTVTISESTSTHIVNAGTSSPLSSPLVKGGPYVLTITDDKGTYTAVLLNGQTCTITQATGTAPAPATQMNLQAPLRTLTVLTTTNNGWHMMANYFDPTTIATINSASGATLNIKDGLTPPVISCSGSPLLANVSVAMTQVGGPYVIVATGNDGGVAVLPHAVSNTPYTLTVPAPATQAGTQTGVQTGTQTKTQTGAQTGTQTNLSNSTTVQTVPLIVYGQQLWHLAVVALGDITSPQPVSYVSSGNWGNVQGAYQPGMIIAIDEAAQTFTINGTMTQPLTALGAPYVVVAIDQAGAWVSQEITSNGTCTIFAGTGTPPTNTQMTLKANLATMMILTTSLNGYEMMATDLDSATIEKINNAASATTGSFNTGSATITINDSNGQINVLTEGTTSTIPMAAKGAPYLAIATDANGIAYGIEVPSNNNTFTLSVPGTSNNTAGTSISSTNVSFAQAVPVTLAGIGNGTLATLQMQIVGSDGTQIQIPLNSGSQFVQKINRVLMAQKPLGLTFAATNNNLVISAYNAGVTPVQNVGTMTQPYTSATFAPVKSVTLQYAGVNNPSAPFVTPSISTANGIVLSN